MNVKLSYFELAAIVVILIIAFNHWYIALAIALIGCGLYYWHRKNSASVKNRNTKIREKQITKLKNLAIIPYENSIDVGVSLQNNEKLYFKSNYLACWKELRPHTKYIRLDNIRTGNLILTNKRLIVLASDGSTSQVMYSQITNITPRPRGGFNLTKDWGRNILITGNDGEKFSILLFRLIIGDLHSHVPQISRQSSKQSVDTANQIENVPPQMTAKGIFDTITKSTDVPARLDEENRFYDFSFSGEKVSTFVHFYSHDPQKTRDSFHAGVDSAIELSYTLAEKLHSTDYAVRGYIGESDFETLFIQVRAGKTEYALLDDPKFQKMVKDYAPASNSDDNNNPTDIHDQP